MKSIGAVEFQTWKTFDVRLRSDYCGSGSLSDLSLRNPGFTSKVAEGRWESSLSDVESIPYEANRTSISRSSYELRNPGEGYDWATKFDAVVLEACQTHSSVPGKWFVLVHSIEILNLR